MTEGGGPAIQALIAAARAEFTQSLVAKAAAIHALVDRGAWEEARRAAHRLRGSAGVYGFAALGVAAAAIDDLIALANGAPGAEVQAQVAARLDELRTEAHQASGVSP